tara:strand:+ start:5321 stop:7195 length:1875 start_codon:yes stop_codon:yes gene_type:complete
MQTKYLKSINLQIFLISLTLFFIKWFFSFYFYGFEDINIKIIFNPSGDYSYYPFVSQLSNFKFNEGYSKIFTDLNYIGFPFLVILLHAIFFKIFNLFGFIILELICIYFFIKIFFHIFKEISFSNMSCILISLLLFTIPSIVEILNSFNIPYSLNFKQLYSGFYNLRFPRPLITNLFFFSFILFLIKYYLGKKPESKKFNLFLAFIFLGALFNSFFFFFIVCSILLFWIIILELKKDIFKKENLVLLLQSNIILLIVCLPFLLQIFFIEQDYYSRIGTFTIDSDIKYYLGQHLLKGFLKPEFIVILISNIIIYYININLNPNNKKFLNFFWLLFFSSVLAPISYLLFMNKITFFGNFVFIIALSSLILLKFNIILLLFSKVLQKEIKKSFIFFIIFFLIFSNSIYFFKNSKVSMLSEGEHFKAKNIETFRDDFLKTIKFLKNNSDENSLLLTNDIHTQLWWIFSKKKNYYFPYVFFVSLTDDMIETQLINAFKYLKLKENDFINFFNENKITNWRVVNTNNYFFLGHLKYQANFLTKRSNINNYPEKTKKFILKQSIHHTNQVILSKEEVERLKEKFANTALDERLEPDIIVLTKDSKLTKNLLMLKNFFIEFENSNFVILKKK